MPSHRHFFVLAGYDLLYYEDLAVRDAVCQIWDVLDIKVHTLTYRTILRPRSKAPSPWVHTTCVAVLSRRS